MMSHMILIVEDDTRIANWLKIFFEEAGFTAETANDGRAGLNLARTLAPDLIVLDLMLPGEHGLSIARRLKGERDIPIIIVSAQGEDVDRIVGLEVGADDYLGKPFNPRELLARIRAVLRRIDRPLETGGGNRVLFGPFELDSGAYRLTREGVPVPLTSGEFDLLCVLTAHPNKVLDRDRILDLLTGAERSPFDRSIDVRVTRLRSKIEPDPAEPVYIKTIWGKGYMFCPDG